MKVMKQGSAAVSTEGASDPDLSWLLEPCGVDRFFAQYWGKEALHIQRSDPDYFRGVLTPDDLESVIAYSIAKEERTAGPVMVVENRKHSEAPLSLASGARYFDAYARGSTLVFNSLHRLWTPVGKVCRAVSEHFRAPAIGNAYLTPKDAQGFPAHYDTHDVLVLQLHGEKTWRLRGVGARFPLKPSHRPPALDIKALPKSDEVKMKPGDVLYLPRGVVHEASTARTSSLHLTIGIMSFTVEDLLVQAIGSLAERREELRRSLPLATNKTERAALKKLLLAELARLDTRAIETAEQRLEARRVQEETWAVPGGRFDAIDHVVDLTPTTRIVKRWGMPISALVESQGVVFGFPGEVMVVPGTIVPALQFIQDHDAFLVGDLPGLSDGARQVLVGRMIKSGLLRVVAEPPAKRRTTRRR